MTRACRRSARDVVVHVSAQQGGAVCGGRVDREHILDSQVSVWLACTPDGVLSVRPCQDCDRAIFGGWQQSLFDDAGFWLGG